MVLVDGISCWCWLLVVGIGFENDETLEYTSRDPSMSCPNMKYDWGLILVSNLLSEKQTTDIYNIQESENNTNRIFIFSFIFFLFIFFLFPFLPFPSFSRLDFHFIS